MESKGAKGGMPTYDLDRDYPILWERAKEYDATERVGATALVIDHEISVALHELWDTRAAGWDLRDIRQILNAWGLGDIDKMNVLMLSAFLRHFGTAPAIDPAGIRR